MQPEGTLKLTLILDMVFPSAVFLLLVVGPWGLAIEKGIHLPMMDDARRVVGSAVSTLALDIDSAGNLQVYGHVVKDVDAFLAAEAQTESLVARRTNPDLQLGDELPTTVVIRADRRVPFRYVGRVIQSSQKYGFHKFALKGQIRVTPGVLRWLSTNVVDPTRTSN